MNREKLERANALTRAIDVLDDLNRVMCVPYPQFSNQDKQVNSARLDEETLKRLKHVIKDFIEVRRKELTDEFESL